jgi:hypothetical protein
MALSDDLGDLTRFMLSLAEDPKKLAEYRRDPEAVIKRTKLSRGAAELLRQRIAARGDNVIIVVIVVVVV